MPNFSQTYATACGVELPANAPKFPSTYYPVPDKYITLQSSGGHPARNYPLFTEVCNLLAQKFAKLGIKIIQLGALTDSKINFCIDLRGKTTFRQSAFVIENALLHMGVDSSLSHLSGINDIPLVVLTPNARPSVVVPHYCNKKTIAIESDRKGNKPTYMPNDNTISTIKPETVANAVLELLEINERVVIKTLYIGEHFSKDRVIDFIPNFSITPDVPFISFAKLNCRADLSYSLNDMGRFLHFYRGCIVTKKPVPSQFLQAHKENIVKFVLKLDEGYNKDYVKMLDKSGIDYILTFSGEEKGLNDARLDLLDFNPVFKQMPMKKPVDIEGLTSDTMVRSSRSVLSKNHLYLSKYHWQKDAPFNGEPLKIGEAIDSSEFWDSLEHYYLYNI